MLSSLLAKFRPEPPELKTRKAINLIKQTALLAKDDKALQLLDKNKLLKPTEIAQLRGAIYELKGDIDLAKEQYLMAVNLDNTTPLWVKRAAGKPVYSMIHLSEWKMAYFPMPKCASSSIKSLLIKIETDQDLVFAHPHYENPYTDTQPYQTLELDDHYCFAVIRDPIERFLSYHQKNIIEEQSLVKESLAYGFDSQLNLTPSIEEFVDKLETYIFTFDDVRHHTLPQYAYLKDVLPNIQDLYLLQDLDKLHQKLNDWMGRPLLLSHLMESKSKPAFNKATLDDVTLNKLEKFYSEDIKLAQGIST